MASPDVPPGGAAEELAVLLRELSPALLADEYVFCSVADTDPGDCAALAPLATFREDEGLSLVLERRTAARAGFDGGPALRCITLRVHSSLAAVGLTAAVAGALAARGIAANVIAARHHDHVFVPADRAEEALAVLTDLSG